MVCIDVWVALCVAAPFSFLLFSPLHKKKKEKYAVTMQTQQIGAVKKNWQIGRLALQKSFPDDLSYYRGRRFSSYSGKTVRRCSVQLTFSSLFLTTSILSVVAFVLLSFFFFFFFFFASFRCLTALFFFFKCGDSGEVAAPHHLNAFGPRGGASSCACIHTHTHSSFRVYRHIVAQRTQ